MRPARALVLLTVTVATLTAFTSSASAAPAGSAPAVPPTSSAPSASTPHCVARSAGRNAPEVRCYASFRAAISAATGGRLTNAPASPAAAVADPTFAAAVGSPAVTALATYVVGLDYADANYLGASLTLSASGACDNSIDVDYSFASLGSAWNDRISSFHAYNNCGQQLFKDINFKGGALTGILINTANVGPAANDQASSLTFN